MDKALTKASTAVSKLAEQLLDVTDKAETHEQALQALMVVYIAISENNPCCTSHAARAAISVSKRLTLCAASRPADAAVH